MDNSKVTPPPTPPELPENPKPPVHSKRLLSIIVIGILAAIGMVTGGIVIYQQYTQSVTTPNEQQ